MSGGGVGGFAVSRQAGKVLVGVCMLAPAAALAARFWSFDPAAPYEESPNKEDVLMPPHVLPPMSPHVTEHFQGHAAESK